jgi:hypothetical protein
LYRFGAGEATIGAEAAHISAPKRRQNLKENGEFWLKRLLFPERNQRGTM